MRYSTLLAPLALLAVPATAEAADCQPAFVDRDQSLTINGVEIEAGGRAVENFQIRIHNTAASGGAPGTEAAATFSAFVGPSSEQPASNSAPARIGMAFRRDMRIIMRT